MKTKNIITTVLALGILLSMGSCASTKNVRYFQDVEPGKAMTVNPGSTITIRPKDKISIIVTGQDDRINSQFNLYVGSQGTTTGGVTTGYTVDSAGNIDFPVVGTVHVEGLTREQVADYIKKQLQSRNLVKDPVVNVEFMNLGVSVLGEVSSPGFINMRKDNLTLLEALSIAGDLTVFGKRENVTVFRVGPDGQQHTYTVNLNSAEDVFGSPVYYLQQNDVIYVEPNKTRAGQSDVNTNTFKSVSFWLSLASFLMSTAVTVITLVK